MQNDDTMVVTNESMRINVVPFDNFGKAALFYLEVYIIESDCNGMNFYK